MSSLLQCLEYQAPRVIGGGLRQTVPGKQGQEEGLSVLIRKLSIFVWLLQAVALLLWAIHSIIEVAVALPFEAERLPIIGMVVPCMGMILWVISIAKNEQNESTTS